MTRFGIDYAWGSPTGSALKSAGVTFVCRYLSTPGNSKNLSSTEARRLSDAGIDIVVVFETTASRALAGYGSGAADASSALRQARALGMPANRPIFFAVDFDTGGSPSRVDSYFDGIASVLGKSGSGPYGSYEVCAHLLARGFKYAWQSYAWSGGKWSKAQLQQYSNDHTLAGTSCDYDRAMATDFGQWRVGVNPLSRTQIKLNKWNAELVQIRKYVHDRGGHWSHHPIRWARAKRLKRIIKKYEKKLKK